MKKNKYILLFAIVIFIVLTIYACSDDNFKIKTEYGDIFYAHCDSWGESAYVSCPEHNFDITITFFGSKKDITSVCDTEYFRCYKLKNEVESFYICGLKPDSDYFWIGIDEKEPPPFFKEKYSEDFKKVFLADRYIMEVTLNYMDSIYHDEIIEIAKKLTSGDYAGLEEYGLTEEMINDKDSLDEKIKIMNDYLDSQSSNQ